MRFFKYLVFFSLFIISSFSNAAWKFENSTYPTPDSACQGIINILKSRGTWSGDLTYTYTISDDQLNCRINRGGSFYSSGSATKVAMSCPSATEVTLKVPVNAQKYQCVNQCQYALRGCVDIDFEPGMTCSAISTGIECGKTPPTPPKDPSDNTQTPDAPTDTPAAPGQNTNNTNTNTATTTGTSTSTSTSTTTNNTTTNTSTTNTTTTTNINTTTKIDLSSLESAIESIGKILGSKLDDIKDAIAGLKDQDGSGDCNSDSPASGASSGCEDSAKDIFDWLKGDGDKGGVGGEGDNPFGTDVTPQREITPQSLQTNIFGSAAACPADRTLSMNFVGKSFQKTFSFSLWCQQLAILGSLILIAAYAYGAYIIASKS